ncbi:hypothetical protein Hanom_Chr11g01027511 [Helianthus anomalus]
MFVAAFVRVSEIRNCLLSAFELEGLCGNDWHFDSLTYHLSHFPLVYFVYLFYLIFSLFSGNVGSFFESYFRSCIRDNAIFKCGDGIHVINSSNRVIIMKNTKKIEKIQKKIEKSMYFE